MAEGGYIQHKCCVCLKSCGINTYCAEHRRNNKHRGPKKEGGRRKIIKVGESG